MRKERAIFIKMMANIFGLKVISQCLYLVFSFMIIKNLDITTYGIYSYVMAIIVCFSTIPLLGLPNYLQKNIAKNLGIDKKYILMAAIISIIALSIAFYILPALPLLEKISIIAIIAITGLIAILVAIKDGMGTFTFRYQFFLLVNLWMLICILHAIFLKNNITLKLIFNYWLFNSIIILFIATVMLNRLFKSALVWDRSPTNEYKHIFLDLLLLYLIAIPDGFARFYDRYLAHQWLGNFFLGNYAFNLMITNSVYTLFIKPISSIIFTQLAKAHASLSECAHIIKGYYLNGVLIYLGLLCVYMPFSKYILHGLRLEKYNDTNLYFLVCFSNAVLYFLSLPFVMLTTLSQNTKKKLIYSIGSFFIFNIPFFLLWMKPCISLFLIGFIVAYMSHFVWSMYLEYPYVVEIIYEIQSMFGRLNLGFKRID